MKPKTLAPSGSPREILKIISKSSCKEAQQAVINFSLNFSQYVRLTIEAFQTKSKACLLREEDVTDKDIYLTCLLDVFYI